MNSPDPTSSTDRDTEQPQTDNTQTAGDCPRVTNNAVNQSVPDVNRRLPHLSTLPPDSQLFKIGPLFVALPESIRFVMICENVASLIRVAGIGAKG